jgi:amidase
MYQSTVRTNGIVQEFTVDGAKAGALVGSSFLADLFDVVGHVTSAGNPDWLKTHEPAGDTAKAVSILLDAGSNLVGKTCTDELAFSIDGINVHYGIPVNGQYDDRIPGGSSSGSASAVSTGLVDFALGTDTGGSVRVPASYCGIYGFRPSHGRISTEGVVPLAPSLDTVGWLTRSPEALKKVGQTLLMERSAFLRPSEILVARDLFEVVSESIKSALVEALGLLRQTAYTLRESQVAPFGSQDYLRAYMVVQGCEAWKCHGKWIERFHPVFGVDIGKRFDFAKTVTQEQYSAAIKFRRNIISDFEELLSEDRVLCIPTTRDLPPLLGLSEEEMQINRHLTMNLTVIASLARLPQVTMPVKLSDKTTTGLSFLAARGKDMLLLDLCSELENLFKATL